MIDVIPHLVYHINNKDLEQLKALVLDAVAAVKVCFKHVDRDRVTIRIFIVPSGVPTFTSTKVDSSRKKSSGILLCNGGSRNEMGRACGAYGGG